MANETPKIAVRRAGTAPTPTANPLAGLEPARVTLEDKAPTHVPPPVSATAPSNTQPITYSVSDEDVQTALKQRPALAPAEVTSAYADPENQYAVRQPGQAGPAISIKPKVSPVGRSVSSGTPDDEEAQIRHLAGLHSHSATLQRRSEVDPKINPELARQAHLKEALDQIAEPIHNSWKRQHDSAEYQALPLTQRWRAQRDHIASFHGDNPEHAQQATSATQEAHDNGNLARLAHDQEEHRALTSSGVSSDGTMSQEEASAHFGSKANEEDAPTTGVVGGESAKFATQNPEAVKAALASHRFENIPKEDVEVPHLKNEKVKLRQHPELENPTNKALLDRHSSKFAHMMDEGFIDRRRKGISGESLDPTFNHARAADAAYRAMWQATHEHNPNRLGVGGKPIPMDNHVGARVLEAIDSDIKAQNTEKIGSAAKRAASSIEADPAKQEQRAVQSKLVTAERNPEAHAKLMEETRQRLSQHLTPEQQKRHQHVVGVHSSKSTPEAESEDIHPDLTAALAGFSDKGSNEGDK